ncbi:MAG: 30S ribosomal protein S15 [Buchnera aphidicola (Periphyllus lyropictus)]|uniref:30S ribosomal protein S15 n=1 Tax=Buchnera aphidicola TaxID=9 RepID=UPI001EC05B9D|nr:30S ribosomal protein S15 [Buchnera aphidicola]NIH16578.1 30S ribosomal protein S15 [Buchnera aphidicola (Periphyllus lyropictus)]USS94468.1 30S ribosomal protein S15 [Buchnera aphidicola (Periphyllus lyropictus)]
MNLNSINTKDIILNHGKNGLDSGNSLVQIALLTKKINYLQNHFFKNKKDYSSRRGLLKMVSKRRKLLDFLKRKSIKKYNFIIENLKIRR